MYYDITGHKRWILQTLFVIITSSHLMVLTVLSICTKFILVMVDDIMIKSQNTESGVYLVVVVVGCNDQR